MRRILFSMMFFSALTAVPAFAEDIDVTSEIKAATVYNDRATLTRKAVIDVPAGAHNLVFTGIPLRIYTDSLRVGGSAQADVVFGALSHKRESFEDYVVPKEKELNAQLLSLQDQVKVYNAEKSALKTAQEFLQNIGKTAALRENEEVAKLELSPDEWAAAADGLSAKMAQTMKESIGIDIKIRDTNDKIRKIQNDLRQLRTGNKQNYIVSVPFEAAQATRLTVDLSYQISGVSWQPIYDARLDVKSGKMDLVQYGQVWQQTGEDWDDIELTLSTAQPSRGATLPDLYPSWLSIYAPPKMQAMSGIAMSKRSMNEMASAYSAAPMMDDMAEADMAMEAPVEKEVVMQTAQINTEGFVGEYKITGPATVTSDGTKAKLMIGAFDIDSSLQVQVKPQLSTDAFLVAKTTLKGEAPILPGQVSLFRDGAYIGQSYMQMMRPGDEDELSFGIDDNVVVKRNTLMDERSEEGMITKDSVIERHYVTDIQNLHKEAINLAVLETVPASKDERIRVEILKDHTSGGYEADLENVKGVTRWVMDVKPQEKTQVKLGWRVKWPKGENISGL